MSKETRKKVVLKRRKTEAPVEAWFKEATGVAPGKTTTAKIMKLTRGEQRMRNVLTRVS